MEGLVGGAEIISAYTRKRLRRQVPRGQSHSRRGSSLAFIYDEARSMREGWLFVTSYCTNGDEVTEIQKYDQSDIFERDSDARSFVISKANAGSAYHRDALAACAESN
jgi:hypothetical protein